MKTYLTAADNVEFVICVNYVHMVTNKRTADRVRKAVFAVFTGRPGAGIVIVNEQVHNAQKCPGEI